MSGSFHTKAQSGDHEVLKEHLWKQRLILIFSSVETTEKLNSQIDLFTNDDIKTGFWERDLIIYIISSAPYESKTGQFLSSDESTELRNKFSADSTGFSVVLIGKDGTAKESYSDPVKASELFSKIDVMPMRKREMKKDGG